MNTAHAEKCKQTNPKAIHTSNRRREQSFLVGVFKFTTFTNFILVILLVIATLKPYIITTLIQEHRPILMIEKSMNARYQYLICSCIAR